MSILASAAGVLGELVLRHREIDGVPAVELVSNGVILMDTADASTERALATAALDALGDAGGRHVVVGGLGLGCTAQALLGDPRVARVTVVEIEPALLAWAREGLVPGAASLLDDVRLGVVVGDVADVLPAMAPASADGIVLDVDNGPDFLVHPRNAALYGQPFLRATARVLRPGGVLAVWSSSRSPALAAALEAVVGPGTAVPIAVRRGGRDLDYLLYLARRP